MKTATRIALIAVAVMLTTTGAASAADLSESFDTVVPAGWTPVNNSTTQGMRPWWFQGNGIGLPFSAYDGGAGAYAAANFQATTSGTISMWLIAPSLSTLTSGDAWSFYTRNAGPATSPDRLEVRVSTGGSCHPGTGPTSIGDFTTLVTTINPSLVTGGYPSSWTQFSGVLSGLPAGQSTGCLAFRYFVTSAGPGAANSDYIGVDAFRFTEDVISPGPVSVAETNPLGWSSNDTPSVTGSGAEAGSTVRIYDNAACTGTALGSGPAADFNGSTGITATVPQDVTTTLYATATDPSGNESACSSTHVSYTNGTAPPAGPINPPKADSLTPPPAPKLTSFGTGWRTHDAALKLSGRAGDGAKSITLLIYSGQTAVGTPVETQQVPVVNGVWSTKPLSRLVPGAYVAVVRTDTGGAMASSQPVTFEVLGPCQSRRVITLHLYAPKGGYRAIAVTLGGKRLAVRGRKRAPTVRVDLRGRGKGAYTVRISGRTASGRHVRAKRTYRTCGRAVR